MKSVENLSDCDVEVLRLIAQGRSNYEIAKVLGAPLSTANCLEARLYMALGLHCRVYLALYALKAGLIDLEDIELPGYEEVMRW